LTTEKADNHYGSVNIAKNNSEYYYRTLQHSSLNDRQMTKKVGHEIIFMIQSLAANIKKLHDNVSNLMFIIAWY